MRLSGLPCRGNPFSEIQLFRGCRVSPAGGIHFQKSNYYIAIVNPDIAQNPRFHLKYYRIEGYSYGICCPWARWGGGVGWLGVFRRRRRRRRRRPGFPGWIPENGFPRQGRPDSLKKVGFLKMDSPGRGDPTASKKVDTRYQNWILDTRTGY